MKPQRNLETNPSMAALEQVIFKEDEENDENYSESEESDSGYDSDSDPDYSILEDTHSQFSNLSIRKKSKSRIGSDLIISVDENEETVQKIIAAGQLEKLKVEQCKVYLRKNGLRLTGNKCTLIERIKEHLEVSNGEGEKKYPVSSFVLNCKGDACTGDVVMFEQNVYDMFSIASRSASGPPCGKRIVAGRIVKESYGTAKQQHTFTIEVLWSKGEKPLSPLHPLLIKGRNLYRLKTLRQTWEDEGERQKILMEKHSRGSLARSERKARIQEKEKRKMLKANRISIKEDPKRVQSQPHFCIDTNKRASRLQQPAVQPQPLGLIVDSRKPAAAQTQFSVGSRNPTIHPQFAFDSGNASSQSQEPKLGMQNHDQKQLPQMNRLPERTGHRQPLKSINHSRPTSPPHRHGHMKQQLCRYYAQGRCYFGDNCKFLHETR